MPQPPAIVDLPFLRATSTYPMWNRRLPLAQNHPARDPTMNCCHAGEQKRRPCPGTFRVPAEERVEVDLGLGLVGVPNQTSCFGSSQIPKVPLTRQTNETPGDDLAVPHVAGVLGYRVSGPLDVPAWRLAALRRL